MYCLCFQGDYETMNSWARATRAQGEKEEVNLFVVRGARPRNFLGVRSDYQLDSRPHFVMVRSTLLDRFPGESFAEIWVFFSEDVIFDKFRGYFLKSEKTFDVCEDIEVFL